MRILQAALVSASMLAFTPVVNAADQDFTIVNRTGYQIDNIWVSASASNRWGRELLGRGNVLSDGESFDVDFRSGTRNCRYDLKVMYHDKDEATWTNINACDISKASLFYDRRNNSTRLRTE